MYGLMVGRCTEDLRMYMYIIDNAIVQIGDTGDDWYLRPRFMLDCSTEEEAEELLDNL